MKYKVPFIGPGKLYQKLKNELDQLYFEVISERNLMKN